MAVSNDNTMGMEIFLGEVDRIRVANEMLNE